MSYHTAKKAYAGTGSQQASITSYFSPSIAGSSPAKAKDTNSISSQELPAHIQSNLISVGMRIRKSVPEGYKTGSDYSAFTLFSDPAAPQTRPGLESRSVSTPSMGRARARELTPWCGILKVGGMAQQMMDEDEDEVPFFSSQESTASNASVVSREGMGSKRRFFEEEEEEEDAEEMQVVMGQRVMAHPRRRKMHSAFKSSALGQENESMDFGEADFLDYSVMEEVDMADS
ncbi:hypothetical protein BP5796_11226 [Coleophoma crateriformis]|uniref:Uncharacterized protein n=1 Tax=Coleophoma crateriformis TaxID=565419 RepID=A0A3D8QIS3_9HELO|nr:hypothetical protein BP5796_11226 [Coleophoma crateriformis]